MAKGTWDEVGGGIKSVLGSPEKKPKKRFTGTKEKKIQLWKGDRNHLAEISNKNRCGQSSHLESNKIDIFTGQGLEGRRGLGFLICITARVYCWRSPWSCCSGVFDGGTD